MQCWKCHGVDGRANGPSASTLQDDLGRPILPYNFTSGDRPKCGSTDADLYRIFMTGLDGTPMPSFADNIKPDEAWDLVFDPALFAAISVQGKTICYATRTEANQS